MNRTNWTKPRFSMKQAVIVLIATIAFGTILTIADYVL